MSSKRRSKRLSTSELAALPLKEAVAIIKEEGLGDAKIFRDGTMRLSVPVQLDPDQARFLDVFCRRMQSSRRRALRAVINRELIRSLTEIAIEMEGT